MFGRLSEDTCRPPGDSPAGITLPLTLSPFSLSLLLAPTYSITHSLTLTHFIYSSILHYTHWFILVYSFLHTLLSYSIFPTPLLFVLNHSFIHSSIYKASHPSPIGDFNTHKGTYSCYNIYFILDRFATLSIPHYIHLLRYMYSTSTELHISFLPLNKRRFPNCSSVDHCQFIYFPSSRSFSF